MRIDDILGTYNFTQKQTNDIYEILTPHYKILKWIKEENKKAISYTKFINNLDFTKQTFLELNNHIKNDGYTKLAKRCDFILDQLEKYKTGKKISSKMESYFNKTFKSSLPTKTNVLSLGVDCLYIYVVIENTKKSREIIDPQSSKNFIEYIFNVGKFNTSLKYTTIEISVKNGINEIITSRINKNKGEKYRYFD